MRNKDFPEEHSNKILEKESIRYFQNKFPVEWIYETPHEDYGIDLNVGIVDNSKVLSLNFSVQLKAKKNCKGKLSVTLKKTTLRYLMERLEPIMIVLYDKYTDTGYWKWLSPIDFDLSSTKQNFRIEFSEVHIINNKSAAIVSDYVRNIFLVKNRLLTSEEHNLLTTSSDLEAKGWAHYIAKNYIGAISIFKQLLNAETKVVWLLALAQCYYSEYNYEEALYNINTAIDLDSEENILLTKGCILAEQGIESQDFYKLNQAERIFSDLYSSNPSSVNCYNYANTLYNLGSVSRSEELYIECLSKYKNYAEAWKNLGQIYDDQDLHEKALECYEKALEVNPNLSQAMVGRAITWGRGYKRYLDAISSLKQCIELDKRIPKKIPIVYYWISFFYSKERNYEESWKWVEIGIHIFPGNFLLRRQKGCLLIYFIENRIGYLDDAIKYFEENTSYNSKDGLSYTYLCKSLKLKGEETLFQKKIDNWFYSQMPYSIEDASIFRKHDDADLLDVISHWESISKFVLLNPTANYIKEIKQWPIDGDYEPFLKCFEFSRLVLFSKMANIYSKKESMASMSKLVLELIDDVILGYPRMYLKQMLRTTKGDEAFSKEFSRVIMFATDLWLREFYRVLGFSAEPYNVNHKEVFDSLDHKIIYQNILLKFAEQLYIDFELPM